MKARSGFVGPLALACSVAAVALLVPALARAFGLSDLKSAASTAKDQVDQAKKTQGSSQSKLQKGAAFAKQANDLAGKTSLKSRIPGLAGSAGASSQPSRGIAAPPRTAPAAPSAPAKAPAGAAKADSDDSDGD